MIDKSFKCTCGIWVILLSLQIPYLFYTPIVCDISYIAKYKIQNLEAKS